MKWKQLVGAGMGGLVGQITALAALPLISRLYSQEDIGTWAIWLGASTILGSVAYLRYELAIVVAGDDEEARNLAVLCGSLLLAGTGLGIMACAFPAVRKFVGQGVGIETWIPFTFPIMALGIGWMQIMQSWCVRRQWYGMQSVAQAVFAVAAPVFQVVGGLWGGGAEWLVGGTLGGQWIAAVVLGVFVQRKPWRLFRKPSSVSSLLTAARRYKAFSFYSAPYTLFGVVRDRASLFILQAFVTSAQVGQYAFIWRSLNFPVTLISGAIRPVLFRDSAAMGVDQAGRDIRQILTVLALAGTPWAVLFFVMPGEWLSAVFGKAWSQAGFIGAWVIWIAFSYLFCNWLDRLMDVLQRQRLTLMMEMAFSTLALCGMIWAFYAGLGFRGALAAQTTILVTYNLVYLVVAFHCAGYNLLFLGRLLVLAALTGLGSASVWLLCRWAWSPWASVGIYIGIYLVSGAALGWRLVLRRRG
jgi:O-antigen/teichoic acid export membrane protein